MIYLNNPTSTQRIPTPITEAKPTIPQPTLPSEAQEQFGATVTQVTDFVKDHFVQGGKLGISFAVAATRIAQGFARANTEAFKARLPEIQRHIAELPTALRAAIVTGGDAETRDILRQEIAALSGDASLAARTGLLWGAAGLAYAALPLTVTAGYALGAALGEQRANRLIADAMDSDASMQDAINS